MPRVQPKKQKKKGIRRILVDEDFGGREEEWIWETIKSSHSDIKEEAKKEGFELQLERSGQESGMVGTAVKGNVQHT